MLEPRLCPICKKERITTNKDEAWICGHCITTIIIKQAIKDKYRKRKEGEDKT